MSFLIILTRWESRKRAEEVVEHLLFLQTIISKRDGELESLETELEIIEPYKREEEEEGSNVHKTLETKQGVPFHLY
ncbi:hypothetical protein K1719_010024 [Acacia pycnantha]|nr:hypothetical protein K1719_010024 [Acacia pycnantha]